MKYDNLRAFELHLKGAAPKHFNSVYLIMGKEEHACTDAAKRLLRMLLPEEEQRKFSITTLEGSQTEPDELIQQLRSVSFFSPKLVIWVKNADKLKKDVLEAIDEYLSSPTPGYHLVLSGGAIHKSSNFYKKVEKEGVVLDFAELKPWEKENQLLEWLGHQATSIQKIMAQGVSKALVKQSGCDAAILSQEWAKLLCYVGDRREITLQDLSAICSHLESDTIWQMGEAIFKRDGLSALKTLRTMQREGVVLLPFLRQLRSQFQTGIQISGLLRSDREKAHAAIQQQFPYMKGQILERNIEQALFYGFDAYKKGVLAIDAAEASLKNSDLSESMIAELLIITLTTPIHS